jgi:hypothetical protein
MLTDPSVAGLVWSAELGLEGLQRMEMRKEQLGKVKTHRTTLHDQIDCDSFQYMEVYFM